MLMMLRRTGEDSWIEPCAEAQPCASKGRREAGVVFLAGLHDVSSARVNVLNPRVFTEALCSLQGDQLLHQHRLRYLHQDQLLLHQEAGDDLLSKAARWRLRWTGAARRLARALKLARPR